MTAQSGASPLQQATNDGPTHLSNATPPEEMPHTFNPSRSFILAFSSICLVTLTSALDATSLSIALPIITDRLHGTAIQAFWSGTAFLVASGVVQPMVLFSSACFALGSLVAALSTGFTMMIIGRSIQGTGGGGMLAMGEILITDLVPLAARGSWLGAYSGVWAIGTVVGPLMGGGFAQASHSGWRWIFWINLPLIGVGVVATIFFLRIKQLGGTFWEAVRSFDWMGSTIGVAATVAFLIPISWGGTMFAWASWHTLVPLLVGAAGLVAFGLYEYRLSLRTSKDHHQGRIAPSRRSHTHTQPIIRPGIFRNWTLRLAYFQTLTHGILLWSLLYFLPLYYEGVKGYSPIIAAVAILPETLLTAPTSVLTGLAITRVKHYRWAIWIGWALTTVGFALLTLLSPSTTIPSFIFLNVPVSIGTGITFTAMSLAIQAAADPKDAAFAITFYSFIRVIGQSLGIAIGGAVFQNQIFSELSSAADDWLASHAAEFGRDATSLVGVIAGMSGEKEKEELTRAFARALKMVWIVMTALSGVMFISSIFVQSYPLEQEHKTLQGLAEAEKKSKRGESAIRDEIGNEGY
ncbi:MFS general substrate transporter [Penicillium sp. CMV-2018d]|nr:MFS general substrate transporter [Penicillium sp. CMV-2018d]